MDRRVNAVVLNYNQSAATCQTVSELARSRGIDVDVLVVDCASAPDQQQALRQCVAPESLLLLPQNRGYAGGMNAGIQFWLERAPDTPIMLVTPDARVSDDVAFALWEEMDRDDKVGAAGPLIIYADAPNRRIGAGGEISRGRIRLHSETKGSAPSDVDWVEGCCWMLRPAALRSTGGLDDEFFLYYEEIDLCLRLTRAGWHVRVVPAVSVRHPKSAGQQPAHFYYYMTRNGFRFQKKNFGTSTLVASIPIILSILRVAGTVSASALLPRRWRELPARSLDFRRLLQGVAAGTRDHINGSYGQRAESTQRPR